MNVAARSQSPPLGHTDCVGKLCLTHHGGDEVHSLMMSLSYGLDLAPEQIAKGLGHERAWALDLISDTPYLLTVWLWWGGYYDGKGGKPA